MGKIWFVVLETWLCPSCRCDLEWGSCYTLIHIIRGGAWYCLYWKLGYLSCHQNIWVFSVQSAPLVTCPPVGGGGGCLLPSNSPAVGWYVVIRLATALQCGVLAWPPPARNAIKTWWSYARNSGLFTMSGSLAAQEVWQLSSGGNIWVLSPPLFKFHCSSSATLMTSLGMFPKIEPAHLHNSISRMCLVHHSGTWYCYNGAYL